LKVLGRFLEGFVISFGFLANNMFLCKKIKAMEVKEPVVAYGALSDPIEEMLCGVKAHKCELDLALEEVRQGKLKSYDSVDALLAELSAGTHSDLF
jgi:hypothetical protein